MSKCRKYVGVVVVACSGLAAVVSAAIAASDPRGLDLRDDYSGRLSPLMLGSEADAPPRSVTAPVLRGNPLWGISLQSLGATRERPLFSPSRRPPMSTALAPPPEPVKVAVPAESNEPPPFNLVGVVTGTKVSLAIFVNTTTHDTVSLRIGEGHDGWILQSVSGREVVLERNNRTAVVSLPKPTGEQK
jgi:general secretion pathway protein N